MLVRPGSIWTQSNEYNHCNYSFASLIVPARTWIFYEPNAEERAVFLCTESCRRLNWHLFFMTIYQSKDVELLSGIGPPSMHTPRRTDFLVSPSIIIMLYYMCITRASASSRNRFSKNNATVYCIFSKSDDWRVCDNLTKWVSRLFSILRTANETKLDRHFSKNSNPKNISSKHQIR